MNKSPNVARKYGSVFTVLLMTALILSCKSFLEIGAPKTELITATVFENEITANAAVEGMYRTMFETSHFLGGGLSSVTFISAGSADELDYNLAEEAELSIHSNRILPNNSRINDFWKSAYQTVYQTNGIIEGLNNSNKISEDFSDRLTGEAKFIRAFCHFYLVSAFGPVPIITGTDYKINANIERQSVQNVLNQVISDLKHAQTLLSDDYRFSDNQRVRATRWAATALLSRVFLYQSDFENAEKEASKILENTALFELISDPAKVFLKNSREAIWQLMGTSSNINTFEGLVSIPYLPTSIPNRSLTASLLNAFEPGDRRRSNWVTERKIGTDVYHYPYKYKIASNISGEAKLEYSMVLRFSEQLLIRAEARAQLGKIAGSQEDLNKIRKRAGLSAMNYDTKEALMKAIEQERRIEFFVEWGHRWFDLKRWGKADEVLGIVKKDWRPNAVLYPLPQTELNTNSLLTQNKGY